MSNSNPTVSVIIPTYNRAHLVARAICSVIAQTYQDFEIIVVDDASKDNTEEVVRRLGDHRIRYIQHEGNRGGSAARNTGIRAAHGEYIAFLDSDDEWLPEKLERQVASLRAKPSGVGVAYTRFWRVKEGEYTGPWPRKCAEGNVFLHQLSGLTTSPTSCMLLRATCFDVAGLFDEELPARQEDELKIRLSRAFEFTTVHEPLVKIHLDSNLRISAEYRSILDAMHRIIVSINGMVELTPSTRRRAISRRRCLLGQWLLSSSGDVAAAREELKLAWKTYPWNLYCLALWCLSGHYGLYRLLAKLRGFLVRMGRCRHCRRGAS